MDKLDIKTKVAMVYSEILFLVVLIAEVVWDLSIVAIIAIIVVAVASMYVVDRIALKKGCELRKKYRK